MQVWAPCGGDPSVSTVPGNQRRSRGTGVRVRERVGVAMFVVGSTFLWVVPPFAGPLSPTSFVPTALHLLGVVTVLAYGITAWTYVRGSVWWAAVACVAGVLGLATTVLVGLEVSEVRGSPWLTLDLVAHAVGSLTLVGLALIPRWRAHLVRVGRRFRRRLGAYLETDEPRVRR